MWLRAAALVLFAVTTARAEPAHAMMWRALSPAVLDRIAARDEARSERMSRDPQLLALDRGVDAELAAVVTRACGAAGRLVERAHGMSAFAIVDNIGSSPRVAPRTIILGLRFAR